MKKIFLLFLLFCTHTWATTFTDLKFGQAQIADSQWNVSACMYTATCQIYSKNPGTAYKIPWYSGQLNWAAGDYVKFAETGNAANPYNAIQYNSSGTQKAVMGTGHIINMGTDYFFFVGNDNDTGQLFSMTSGFNSTAGVTWTGTLNPTTTQVNTYASNGSTTPLSAGQTAPPPVTYTTTYSTQTTSKVFSNRTLTYSVPMKTITNNSTGAATTTPVTPATLPSGYISNVSYSGSGGWEIKNITYTATTTGTGYVMFAFRNDPNYWVMDNVSVKANNAGANLLVNGGLDKTGLMTVNVGGTNQTVAAPTAWGLAYQTNQSTTLGGGYDSGMWYDTSTGSFGAIYQNINFTAGTTYTISFMVASDYNTNGNTVQMGVYAGSCDGSSTACTLPVSTGMTSAVTPSQTYTVGCTTDCPTPPATPTAIYMNNASVKILRAIPTTSNSPNGEGPNNAFDNNPNTKYLNFDKKNAGVTVQLNTGKAVTGFTVTTANDFSGRDPTSYKLYGSNDGSTWTLIKEDTLTLSDSRFTTSAVVDVANTTAYAYYFMLFPTTKAGEGCGQNCNSMQIAEITYYYDANSTATSTASSNTIVDPVTAAANTLCCGGSSNSFNIDGTQQAKILTFVNRTTADSRVFIEQINSNNVILVEQSGTKNNYTNYYGHGSNNEITINQSGVSTTQVNYTDLQVVGNTNKVNITQQSTGGGKSAFVSVNDNNNIVTIQQKDSGSHYANVSVSGGYKEVDILQQGSASHMANVTLTGPQPASIGLTQSGSTQQFYTINYNCATAGGCAKITVNQGQ